MDPRPEARLSILVPLHNESAGVAALAERMRTYITDEVGRPAELILIDDGSTDDTHDLLLAHFASGPFADSCKIVQHDRNRGLTDALTTGLRASEGELVGWLDSDLTYDPAILTELAAALDAGADVALASCYHPDGKVDGVPGWRLWLSRLASDAYRRVTRAPIHTFTSMVRVYRRAVLDQCPPDERGFLGVTDVLLQAIDRGHDVVEVPAVLRRRRAGQSKMRIVLVGLGHLRMLARWRKRSGRRSTRGATDRITGDEPTEQRRSS